MSLPRLLSLTIAASIAMAPCAFAHPQSSHGSGGFAAGFAHPLLGWDHMLAALAIGLLAARVGGVGRWLLPVAFVASMGFGGFVGSWAAFPSIEVGIALSLVCLGVFLAARNCGKLVWLTAAATLFGALHGHTHGTEMPTLASASLYFAGILTATAGLQWVAIIGGNWALHTKWNEAGLRWTGVAVASTGACLLCGMLV